MIMSVSKPIQLFGKNGDQYEVITSEIISILDKIGDKNVAIVSINGNKRTGKSFLLNYLLRYLKYNKLYGNQWINGVNEETLDGFHWRGGAERDTVGIWMWSEPYIVKDKYGNDIALLLLDTQGNFDEKTSFKECSVIFSLSLLMSTTLIININRDVSEDKLHFVEFFTNFAESFTGKSHSSEALFQKLVFLIRDWQNDEDFPFGYHDQYTPIKKNYMRRVITPNSSQCLEAQNKRKQILRYFNHVSSYLMPTPGRKVFTESFRGQTELLDKEFVDNIANFVPIMLYSYNIEPKTIGGQLMTGNILKHYLNKWSEVIRTQKIPEAKSLTAATAKVNQILTFKHSLDLYNTSMSASIESKPTDLQLCIHHKTAKQQSLDYFVSKPNVRISEYKKTQKLDDLAERIEQMFVMLRSNNNYRADKEEIEKKLNAANAVQVQMQSEIEKINREYKKQITDLECKISDVQNESKTKLAKQEKRFKEERDNLRQSIYHQNSEHRTVLADLERRNVQQREDLIRKHNQLIQQMTREFKEHIRSIEESNEEMVDDMNREMDEKMRRISERERESNERMRENDKKVYKEKERQFTTKIQELENKPQCILQ